MGGRYAKYAIIWALLLLTVYLGDRLIRDVWLTANEPRAITARGALAEFEQTAVALFQEASPSVVYLFTEGANGAGGAGSGFVWDRVGHVVTNFHVVEDARQIAVRLDDGEAVRARLVGVAPDFDLAVVRLDENRANLKPIPVGTSADLKVGQAVYAIGNPFGLSRTLTTGIISALNRRLPTARSREVSGVIQTDAAINPGNSGGPLLDSAGRLIGVNTAILSESGSSAGIGFAVPVDVVNEVVPRLIRDGRVPRPGIGISVVDEETAARSSVAGLVIAEVQPGSAAARAGLRGIDRPSRRIGDVITHVDGKPVRTIAEFAHALGIVGIGKEATLTVRRGGETLSVKVTVVDIG
ncbi:MAG: trypsin-like serine protease [Alphaproteobacteria bacterium]|nr:trypsin-like serine protease [Alphaproteobacteria bacterium]